MTPRFPLGSVQYRIQYQRRAERAIGAWAAATLNPAIAVRLALPQMTLVSLADAAALRAHYDL